MIKLQGEIVSDLDQVDPLCQKISALLHSAGLSEHAFAADLLLREFLNNAIIHGNRQDPAKRVRYVFRVGSRLIAIFIKDEGRGFNTRRNKFVLPDPTVPGGRGLVIGKEYTDRMQFNRDGTEVRLWIRIDQDRQKEQL